MARDSNDHGGERRAKKKQKFKVFDESGMTEAERRALRQRQRALREELKAGEHGSVEALSEARGQNNELFQKVCYTREAVLDADNLDDIAHQFAKKAEKDVQVPRFDPLRLVLKLKQKCSTKTEAGKYFDWRKLGLESGICFNALPDRVAFLAGSLDVQVALKKKKTPRKRVKHVEEEADEVNPERVNNNETRSDAADKLSAMEKNMKQLKKKLYKKHKEAVKSGDDAVDGVKFLVNPKSFTQTVENIFNFTFLIKKGEAEMAIRSGSAQGDEQEEASGLVIKPRAETEEATESTQAVLAFTMNDWKRLCDENFAEGEEGGLPHRTGSTIRSGNASQE